MRIGKGSNSVASRKVELEYFDKISPCGVMLNNVGNVHSPFLRDIAKAGYRQYQYSLVQLLYSPEQYIRELGKITGKVDMWERLTNDEKNNLSMFDLLTLNDELRTELISVLSFFITGVLEWDDKRKMILVNKKEEADGKISVDGYVCKENYATVVGVCLQLADIETDNLMPETPKFKTEKDRKFYEDFMKKKSKYNSNRKQDPDFELANMISVISVFHNSLNFTNVYDLTVAQVHDTFKRLLREHQLNIHETNYAVWGGKYDSKLWYQNMDDDDNRRNKL